MRMEVGQQDMLALGQRTHTPTITHTHVHSCARCNRATMNPFSHSSPRQSESARLTMAGVTAGGDVGRRMGDRGSEGRL